MLKARNRKLSLILILAMLMTMFAGLGTASAATTSYSCLQAPYITKGADVSANDATIGTILVNWDVLMGGPHSAIISLPGDLEFKSSSVGTVVVTKPGDQMYNGTISLDYISAKEAKITVPAVGASVYNDVQAAIRLDNIKVSNNATAGPVNVTFSNLSGLFPQGSVTIGNITGGAAQVTVVETQTITEGSSTAIEFTIQEDSALGLKAENDTIKFKLPKGFSWTDTPTITNVATGATLTSADFTFSTSSDDRELKVSRLNTALGRSIFRVKAYVQVDETEADFGDVNVSVSGKSTLAPNSVLIGTYSDYGYEVVVDEVAEILSGRAGEDATIKFNIKENVKGSLLDGRTIYFTLPDGVEWTVDEDDVLANFEVTTEDGVLDLNNANIVKNKPEMVKATINNDIDDKGEVEIEAQLRVAANYVGDITVELSGSAGIDETVKVAEAIAPLTGSVDMVEVKIGVQSQKAGDITITETVKEALMSDGTPTLTLTLPAGASWSKVPTVTVNNGLSIGTVTRQDANGTTNARLVIPIRAQSDEAATITISDVYLTVDRTVPEGALNATVSGAAINAAGITNRGTALSLKVAEVVTPAPGETVGSCEFKIGSNIYYVGGVAKVMDVAPYIKGDRTYVPMRYLGETLGAEVVWDDAARTVTLTKGETTVVFTIGSTSYTVNGEAKTADVAPEISNDRTMLPARFVAEAFGAVVGWDASTQTVLIQK